MEFMENGIDIFRYRKNRMAIIFREKIEGDDRIHKILYEKAKIPGGKDWIDIEIAIEVE